MSIKKKMKKAIAFIPALLLVFLVQASSLNNLSSLTHGSVVNLTVLIDNISDIDHSANIKDMPGKRLRREKRAERKLKRNKKIEK